MVVSNVEPLSLMMSFDKLTMLSLVEAVNKIQTSYAFGVTN
jgi:hypothetical protein